MRILVVSNKNGSATVKPFNDNKNHAGEAFWVHGKTLKVGKDNRITFGKKFMEQYGHIRDDGRRAFVMETGTKWLSTANLPKGAREKYGMKKKTKDNRYFVRGANILNDETLEKYYSGRTGQRIPAYEVEYGDNGAIKLRPENTVDVYGD